MAIKLTETKLRQIIREEITRIAEMDYVSADQDFSEKIFEIFEDLYLKGDEPTVADIISALGPIPKDMDFVAAMRKAGLDVRKDGTVYWAMMHNKSNY